MVDSKQSDLKALDEVVVRFAGDSGDGMQLTGDRFTNVSAILGNDLATFPNFPAEIRAPAGTVPGVSAFQVHIADYDILTPGDTPNVLVAMNPAALKANINDLEKGATLIVNSDNFDERSLNKAGYKTNPLTDGTLKEFKVYEVPITSLTLQATKELNVKPRDAERSKNFFALGLVSWMFSRPTEPTIAWIEKRYQSRPEVLQSNLAAFKAGYNFGETAEIFESRYEVPKAQLTKGTFTIITGNQALAWGLVTAAHLASMDLFLGSYPITPASDILHELAKLKNFGVKTFQAEDEIAAVGSALGAAYGGNLGVTTSSGPGLDLKEETIGLAVTLELPLIVVDVQRAGPSTGMPTKTEQADLLMALFGRHGEAPVAIVAPITPSDCFYVAIEAARIALTYRSPVIILTDAYLANGSEPFKVPDPQSFEPIDPHFATSPNSYDDAGAGRFYPYLRDEKTLIRQWAIPGTPGLEHRIGGLEKEDITGNVSYDPINHEHMVRLRQARVEKIVDSIEELQVDDPEGASVLVLGWGSTYGAIATAVRRLRLRGANVAHAQLRWINPLPKNLGELLTKYDSVIVPEINLGQLAFLLKGKFLKDIKSITKIQGVPFRSIEIENGILKILGDVK
jgi:2-oxoglutarate ferredoxin oxidoreductase subunit alpha